jgi:hypothetical protein
VALTNEGDLMAAKETYEAPALVEYGSIVECTFEPPRHQRWNDDDDEQGSGFPCRS